MPLLDIAIAQSSFPNYSGYPRVQLFVNGKVRNFSLQCDEKWASLQKSFWNPGNRTFYTGHCIKPCHPKLLIKAVATLEQKFSVERVDGEKKTGVLLSTAADVLSSAMNIDPSSEDLENLDDREKLRRMRISKANKGNTPWNKGRKHSPETLQRIRERTRLAMQNPKVKMKLATSGHAQSEETREKIAVGVRMGWQRRCERLILQETCLFDWQNLIAEAARAGFLEEEELQWNSYEILNEQLQQEWLDSIEYRKTTRRPTGSKRAPKSLEQRRKIAEAIAAKWADPEYRSKVQSGLAKYHGTPEGVERGVRKKPDGERQSAIATKKKANKAEKSAAREVKMRPHQPPKLKKRTTPKFKDPLASTKLEMLKSIRAQRAASETKNAALQQAELLIEEAEKAAKALEVAAMKSPVAQASLIETRKLIAEAIQSIETIKNQELASQPDNSSGPQNLVEQNEHAHTEDLNQSGEKRVNGVASLLQSDQDFNLYKLTMLDEMDSDYRLPTNLTEHKLPEPDIQGVVGVTKIVGLGKLKDPHHSTPNGAVRLNGFSSPNGTKVQNHQEQVPGVAKKWVRGRLVDVAQDQGE